jgi:hypothetical protein
MRGYVIPAKAEHIIEIACNIREHDRREINAATNIGIMQAIYRSYRLSTSCYTGMVDDKPAIIFGVAPISVLSGVGAPWLIGTDGVDKVKRQFILECRTYLLSMGNTYPELRNYVDVRNNTSIRWLKWLGFEFSEPVEYGVNGELFYPFARRAA